MADKHPRIKENWRKIRRSGVDGKLESGPHAFEERLDEVKAQNKAKEPKRRARRAVTNKDTTLGHLVKGLQNRAADKHNAKIDSDKAKKDAAWRAEGKKRKAAVKKKGALGRLK